MILDNMQYVLSLHCISFGDACIVRHLYCYSHSSPRCWFSKSFSESVGNINVHGVLMGFCSEFLTSVQKIFCSSTHCVWESLLNHLLLYFPISLNTLHTHVHPFLFSLSRPSVSPSQLNDLARCVYKTALFPLKINITVSFVSLVSGYSAEIWCTVYSWYLLDLLSGIICMEKYVLRYNLRRRCIYRHAINPESV